MSTSRPRRSTATATTRVPVEQGEVEVTTLSVAAEPSRDEIAQLAYLYWIERGCQNGSADEDWLRAERELRKQLTSAAQA